MNQHDRKKFQLWLLLGLPAFCWWLAVKKMGVLGGDQHFKKLLLLIIKTPEIPLLWGSALSGLVLAILVILIFKRFEQKDFGGAEFRDFLRGSRTAKACALKRKTKEKVKRRSTFSFLRWAYQILIGQNVPLPKKPKSKRQITIGDIPVPYEIENLHFLIGGSTGSGKSVLMREMAYKAILRGDRLIVVDPNGDMLSKFYQMGDIILNPYDKRSAGWSIFNELRHDYDFEHYAYSLVPLGKTDEEEEWAGYARLLVQEVTKKLAASGSPSIKGLWDWTVLSEEKALKHFVSGTPAESLFVGADKALKSVRFILSKRLSPHLKMPSGDFSLRAWLEDESQGNLFITWREDMGDALRPLINTWLGILTTAVLSLDESKDRRIWMFLDELASLDKLKDLKDALTKGRKMGLCMVAGLQSTAQLYEQYGMNAAKTLRSCLRSLVVLSGAKSDPETCEDFSRSLGEHEVQRESDSYHHGREQSVNSRLDIVRERIVIPSEIANLKDLTGYLSFTGNYPVSKIEFQYQKFVEQTPPFTVIAKQSDAQS